MLRNIQLLPTSLRVQYVGLGLELVLRRGIGDEVPPAIRVYLHHALRRPLTAGRGFVAPGNHDSVSELACGTALLVR